MQRDLAMKNRLRRASYLPFYNFENDAAKITCKTREQFEEETGYARFHRQERKEYPSLNELLLGVNSQMTAMAHRYGVEMKISRACNEPSGAAQGRRT